MFHFSFSTQTGIISLNNIFRLVFKTEKLFEVSGRLECHPLAMGKCILLFWKMVQKTLKFSKFKNKHLEHANDIH